MQLLEIILIVVGLVLLVSAVAAGGRRITVGGRGADRNVVEVGPSRQYRLPMLIGGALSLVAGLLLLFVVIVPAGFVGVVRTFGQVQPSVLYPGIAFVIPFVNQVTEVDTRVQPHNFEQVQAASREYQLVELRGTMNYHIDGSQAWDLYQRVGLDFSGKVIDPAFADFIKEIVPQYAIGDILAKRDEIRAKTKQALGENLARYHIQLDDIYLSDIQFSGGYSQAIEDKQVAQQRVQTEQQILEQRKIQAQQQVAVAEGDAQSRVARARGEAESNRLVASSLTDQVLLNQYIQKLSDKVQVMLVPGGQQFLFDLKSLLVQGSTAGTTPSPAPSATVGPTPAATVAPVAPSTAP